MSRRIVVVGGGIVGTTIAYELQRAGAPTILVERDIEPQGASAFSFASLTAFDEPQRDAYLLKTHGMIAWRELAKVFGDDLGVHFAGELRWAESPQEGRHLTSLIERATNRGYPVRSISAQEITKREPASQARAVGSACFAPHDGQADPLRAIDVMRGSFADGGGTILVGRASLLVEELGITVRVGNDRAPSPEVIPGPRDDPGGSLHGRMASDASRRHAYRGSPTGLPFPIRRDGP